MAVDLSACVLGRERYCFCGTSRDVKAGAGRDKLVLGTFTLMLLDAIVVLSKACNGSARWQRVLLLNF